MCYRKTSVAGCKYQRVWFKYKRPHRQNSCKLRWQSAQVIVMKQQQKGKEFLVVVAFKYKKDETNY